MKYYNKNGHEISRYMFNKLLKQQQKEKTYTKILLYTEGTTGNNESYKQLLH